MWKFYLRKVQTGDEAIAVMENLENVHKHIIVSTTQVLVSGDRDYSLLIVSKKHIRKGKIK